MIGVNDKGLVDSDGKFFKTCKVFFRDKKYTTILKKINLSQLINISFTKTISF